LMVVMAVLRLLRVWESVGGEERSVTSDGLLRGEAAIDGQALPRDVGAEPDLPFFCRFECACSSAFVFF